MENLKEKTAKGLFWGAMSNGTTQVLNLLFGVILARLLTPAEYGIVGVLAIFSAIAGTIQSGGFGAGLINLKHVTHNDYNSVFWLNICVSGVLYLLLFLSAPLIAVFFKQPCLVLVSRILFLSLPIGALALVSGTYLIKNMMNRELAIISIVALVLAGITGITLALLKFSYWSLVGQQLVYVIVSDIEAKDGDIISIDLSKGILVNETSGESTNFEPFKEFMLNILEDGGLVNHYLIEKE